MPNNNEQNTFRYTYSAKEQKEIQRIRKKYLPDEMSKSASKIDELRRLDRSANKKGIASAVIFGIVGVLILALGMACILEWDKVFFVPGLFIGGTGIVLIISCYPLYMHITRKERKKIAYEVLTLTDELLGNK